MLAASTDETGLMERVRKRDPRAMAELYDQFGALVYSLIYRMVRDAGVTEDLVQETFLRVWNQAQGFDPARGSTAAWVLAVARNRSIDWLRSAAGRASRTVFESYNEERPSHFVDMERVMINSDQARRVRQAMERLNEKQRFVIELAYFEGLTQTEMAARMGEPLGTVKTWVRSALKNLREELAGRT